MTSGVSWQTVATAGALALAALPLVYFQWKRSFQNAERQQALKLLRKVELIIAEVSVRLMHLENQAEDFVANEEKDDIPQTEKNDTQSTLNSYYHFDSKGNKLKTKWDSYDVDAELEKLDRADQDEITSATATPTKQAPQLPRKKLLATAAGIEHEFEAILEFLDDIRGDEQVKQHRKAIVAKITQEHFARIDTIRTILK